jgi:uncharacterized protein YcfJ
MKSLGVCAVVVAGLLIAGCETPSGRPYRAGTGALIGAGLGGTLGALSSHHHRTGALVGGAVGALAGGLIGQSMDMSAAEQERLQAQAPQTYERNQTSQPLGLADIKQLSAAGIGDDTIISQIRNSGTVYHLSTADIIDLKNAGVSERVIDYMINTPSTAEAPVPNVSVAPPPADPPPVEIVPQAVVVAPGPDFIWIDGAWAWGGVSWTWVGGHWARPPFAHARWVGGRRFYDHGRYRWVPGHWH